MAANWSELNGDILVEIAIRIPFHKDFVAFSRVCTSWRHAAIIKRLMYKLSDDQLPILMFPPEKGCNQRAFVSLSRGVTQLISLPEATSKKCFSSKGWLLTIGRDWGINLLHPFTRIQIKLPHLKAFKNWDQSSITDGMVHTLFLNKFVLSSNPLMTPDYTIMVTYGSFRRLAYCKPGSKVWTTVDTGPGVCEDVIYHENKFYAVNSLVRIFSCDMSVADDEPIVARQVAEIPDGLVEALYGMWYVVVSAGTLFVVRRLPGSGGAKYKYTYATTAFQVFGVELSTNTWTEVKDIGDRAIFLGYNSSFSLETSSSGIIKPNCIYFTDDCQEGYWFLPGGGGKDTGIYNIKDDIFIPHSWGISCNRLNPPMWIDQSSNLF